MLPEKYAGEIWERGKIGEIAAKSRGINRPRVSYRAHNPKVVSSNLTPATEILFSQAFPRTLQPSELIILRRSSSNALTIDNR
jgi:hypothetical protein